jgi:hypothetical protein
MQRANRRNLKQQAAERSPSDDAPSPQVTGSLRALAASLADIATSAASLNKHAGSPLDAVPPGVRSPLSPANDGEVTPTE